MTSEVPSLIVHESGSASDAPAMLFLHPFPYDGRAWREVTQLLPDVHCLCPDLPGCGMSPAFPADTGFEEVADVLIADLRRRGVNRVVVVGESMGGYLALALAEKAPSLVAGLALVDTKAKAEPEAAKEQRLALAAKALSEGPQVVAGTWQGVLGQSTKENNDKVVRLAKAQLAGQRAEGIAWCARAISARADREAVLGNFAGPVLLVRGEEDPLSTPADFEQLAALNAHAKAVTLSATGHLPQFEAPEALAVQLRGLYQSCL